MKIRVNTNRSRVIGTDCNTTVANVSEPGLQGYWDASGGTLPPTAYMGQYWIIGDGVTEGTGGGDIPFLSGTISLAPRSIIEAAINLPGQDFGGWVNY